MLIFEILAISEIKTKIRETFVAIMIKSNIKKLKSSLEEHLAIKNICLNQKFSLKNSNTTKFSLI